MAFIDEMVGTAPLLGVDSVARSVYFDMFNSDFPGAFSPGAVEQMVDIGHPREANAETVLLAAPDLIISGTGWEAANRFLGDIAPTVIWDYDNSLDWRVNF